MFFKSSVDFGLSNCLNAKKYIWNAKYTIQHRIERSQTTKYYSTNSIQYNIHDPMSCELRNCFKNTQTNGVFFSTKKCTLYFKKFSFVFVS